MDIETIKSRIEAIRKTANMECDGIAHEFEDDLYRDFVKYVARRDDVPEDIQDMAELIANISKVDFARWYK